MPVVIFNSGPHYGERMSTKDIFPQEERNDPPEYKLPPTFDYKEGRRSWQELVKALQCVGLSFRTWEDEECPPTGKVRGEKIIAEHVSAYSGGGQDKRAFVYVTEGGLIGIRATENSSTRVFDNIPEATTLIKQKEFGQWS